MLTKQDLHEAQTTKLHTMFYKTTYRVQEVMVGECIFLTVLYSGYGVFAPFL